MKKISFFLERFKKLKPSLGEVEKETKKIISDIFDAKKEDFDVCCQKNDMIIKTNSSVLKNEIFLKKEMILKEVQKRIKKDIFFRVWFK